MAGLMPPAKKTAAKKTAAKKVTAPPVEEAAPAAPVEESWVEMHVVQPVDLMVLTQEFLDADIPMHSLYFKPNAKGRFDYHGDDGGFLLRVTGDEEYVAKVRAVVDAHVRPGPPE